MKRFLRWIPAALIVTVWLAYDPSPAQADPYPPYWGGGSGSAVHYQPVPWPSEDQWIASTHSAYTINDQRTQDPSNGGTSPQNYVNVSSSCADQSLPSIYWYYDSSEDVLFVRWRSEQQANTYATGPNAGTYRDSDPWKSALWTVLFDIDGDGYREFAMHLEGSSGVPSAAVDRLFAI